MPLSVRLHSTREGDGDLCGTARVVIENPAEPFATNNGAGVVARQRGDSEKSTSETLVVALEMVMLDKLADGPSEMPLAEQHELVQALGLDRQDEPLRVRVEVGTVSGELQSLHTGGVEQAAEFVGEHRIATWMR